MADFNTMSDDEHNPFYCPSVPAALFLETVRNQVRRDNSALGIATRNLSNTPELTHSFDEDSFPSFAKILDESICKEDLLEMHYRLRDSTNDDSSFLSSLHWQHQQPAPLFTSDFSKHRSPRLTSCQKGSPAISVTFSDLAASPRRERSVIDVNDGSFELSAKAEKLRFYTDNFLDSPDELGSRSDLLSLALPKSIEGLTSRVHALQGSFALELDAYTFEILLTNCQINYTDFPLELNLLSESQFLFLGFQWSYRAFDFARSSLWPKRTRISKSRTPLPPMVSHFDLCSVMIWAIKSYRRRLPQCPRTKHPAHVRNRVP
ncbi:hypothetical protein BDY19DRAFT_760101 [Irpex rosettiformis]|uniref:Uncharacterized protein n=1 Tax=Irpex rosettiformis TaxID=378272 RepID=A0ACB8U7I1_9APHY|nr:hypothetical protein BDY19DRAFT_760101 [Irpex rosettiformis]